MGCHMRRTSTPHLWALLLILLLQGQTAFGREACTVSPEPEFQGKTVKLECQGQGTFQKYLEKSVCGGSDRDISVVGASLSSQQSKGSKGSASSVPPDEQLGDKSYIAKVTGVPGREGIPLGDVESGMAKRIEDGGEYDDGFQFPDSAVGMSTVCVPGQTKQDHNVFHCTDGSDDGTDGCYGERFVETYGYPYFTDPPCRWRLKDNAWPDIPPPQYSQGDFDQEISDAQTPGTCQDFGGYLNSWQYFDCMESAYDEDGYLYCVYWGNRYICNDQAVLSDGSAFIGIENFGDYDWPNGSGCAGERCRCSGEPRESWCPITPPPPDFENGAGQPDMPYRSFFREYNASYVRKALKTYVEKDKAREDDVRVGCYGFYNEFDPRYQQTTSEDRRCVIDLNETDKRKDSQKGKGKFSDPQEDIPAPKAPEFKQKEHSWWQLLSGGFSLLSPLQNDLSQALPDVGNAKTVGVPQKPPEEDADMIYRGFAPGDYVRDFDDTGPLRTIVRWWHKQETAAASLFTPATVRLVHVPAWAMGLSADDPLFQSGSSASSRSAAWAGTRESPIDLQIHARDDLVGTILTSLSRSLLTIQEVPLPVVVPAGSSTEFRARAQALCTWYITNHPDTKSCEDVSGKTKDVMEKLEKYADQIDQVRELRQQLPAIAGSLLAIQSKLIAPLHAWSQENLERYEQYLEDRQAILALQTQWQGVQQQFNQLHDKTNEPWCMDQRYTTAIYSLLDPWMPTRGDPDLPGNAYEHLVFGGDVGAEAGDLPSLESIPVRRATDATVDLSILQNIPAALKLPVLKVTLVQLDMDQYLPPASGSEDSLPDPKDLPPLDPIVDAIKDAKKTLPTICVPKSSSSSASSASSGSGATSSDDGLPKRSCIKLTWPSNLQLPEQYSEQERAEIGAKIGEIQTMVAGMNDAYDKFWKSLNVEGSGEIEKQKDELKCKQWDEGVCMNVEMDLIERFTRIATRPDVQLKEDFDSTGLPRSYGAVCSPDDAACQLLNPEKRYAPSGWQMRTATGSSSGGSKASDAKTTDEIRKTLRDASLPKPYGTVDTDTMPAYFVEPIDLLRIFDTPDGSPLTPASSSASSSPF